MPLCVNYYVRTCLKSATQCWGKVCWPREYLKTDLEIRLWDTVNSLIERSSLINVFVIRNLALSLLLPLLLVFLFFLLSLMLLYLFVIVSFSQCCYSFQINIAIIVSFVNFLIYTFVFHFWVSGSQIFMAFYLYMP